jgi:hypothetical protein
MNVNRQMRFEQRTVDLLRNKLNRKKSIARMTSRWQSTTARLHRRHLPSGRPCVKSNAKNVRMLARPNVP